MINRDHWNLGLYQPLNFFGKKVDTGDHNSIDSSVTTVFIMFEHLDKSFHYTVTHLGPHKLPLIGRADWNDCLNLNCFSSEPGESFQTTGPSEGPVAESVFIAGMFVKYGKEFEELCRRTGHEELAAEAEKALDSVHERLETKYGVMILQPAYTRYHLELGEITSYPPGYKENAGIFCHNNPWISIAETVIGRGDRAFEIYRKICPSYIEEISEIHRTEPYVYSQMVAGADAPRFGEAKNSWLTVTAAWTFVNLSQALLGIQPDYDGLIVDPCLPGKFGDFKVDRRFRDAEYYIEIHKPEGVQKGVSWIEVDGEKIAGNQIPLVDGKKEYHVIVQMG